MISSRRLCATADGRIVETDDPAAAFLVVCVGGVVEPEWRAAVAEHLGQAAPEPEPEQARTITYGKATEPDIDDAPTQPVAKRTRKPKD